jgi:hypothetical protein
LFPYLPSEVKRLSLLGWSSLLLHFKNYRRNGELHPLSLSNLHLLRGKVQEAEKAPPTQTMPAKGCCTGYWNGGTNKEMSMKEKIMERSEKACQRGTNTQEA